MKKRTITNTIAITSAAVLLVGTLVGCGQSAEVTVENETANESGNEVTINEDDVAKTDSVTAAPYFTKGVYVNYADGVALRDYFYIFYDEESGYTESGNNGDGLPFSCKQEGSQVTFSYGGQEEVARDVLEVTGISNGIITGTFEDGTVMNFEPISWDDPYSFNAQNYINPANDAVFEAATGWTAHYDANLFDVTQQDNYVSFVYNGEGAGTNMVMVTYDITSNAEEAIDKIYTSWGSENATKTKSIFPGTENIDGYWASLPPAQKGSGLYQTAIARDYMDGCLIFEVIGHNTGDEEKDMAISDSLAMIIDSISFPFEQ